MKQNLLSLEQVLGYEFEPTIFTYNEKDVSLYALALYAFQAAQGKRA